MKISRLTGWVITLPVFGINWSAHESFIRHFFPDINVFGFNLFVSMLVTVWIRAVLDLVVIDLSKTSKTSKGE
jgi:hypothetical protein